MNFLKDWRSKIIERKLIEKQNEKLNKVTPELERFCDFLGNIISKYIHKIELNEGTLKEINKEEKN